MSEFKFFIIPRGRTGGTLLATMLNAHPLVSMGYEIYPDLLVNHNGNPYVPQNLINQLEDVCSPNNEVWVKSLERNSFRIFASRARRSGIEPPILLAVLSFFVSEGRSFESLDDRLDFIDALLELQAVNADKPYVGGKMRVDPYVLYARHPQVIYLMMLRDGRDVLDSRLKVGNFKTSPADCAREWCNDLAGFENFLSRTKAKGCLVPYEKLVAEPEKVLTPIMKLANLDFNPLMIDFINVKQALFNNAHGHLSAEQLAGGLSNASIGRWRDGLSPVQLNAFMGVAGDTLLHHGYK